MSQQENLFKSIGQLAQDANARPEVDDDDVRLEDGGEFQEGNEREVEQVESLCMECHEQVSSESIAGQVGRPFVGHDRCFATADDESDEADRSIGNDIDRASLECSLLAFPTFARSSSCHSDAITVATRTLKSKAPAKYNVRPTRLCSESSHG